MGEHNNIKKFDPCLENKNGERRTWSIEHWTHQLTHLLRREFELQMVVRRTLSNIIWRYWTSSNHSMFAPFYFSMFPLTNWKKTPTKNILPFGLLVRKPTGTLLQMFANTLRSWDLSKEVHKSSDQKRIMLSSFGFENLL